MNEIKELLQIIEKGGVIAILIAIIYYGQKQIDKLDISIKSQLSDLSCSFKEMQKETNNIIKDSIRIIAKHNDIEPKINEMIQSFRDILFKSEK